MSKKTDFALGKCKRFSITPYSRGIQREKKLNNLRKAGVGHFFLVHSRCTIKQLKTWKLYYNYS
jgi:hypothetical protein